jgi:hypothetical protein
LNELHLAAIDARKRPNRFSTTHIDQSLQDRGAAAMRSTVALTTRAGGFPA